MMIGFVDTQPQPGGELVPGMLFVTLLCFGGFQYLDGCVISFL